MSGQPTAPPIPPPGTPAPRERKRRWPKVLLIIGILLLSALLLSGIYRLFARAPAETRVPTTDLSVPPTPKPLLAPTVTNRPPLRIAIEPTASYAK